MERRQKTAEEQRVTTPPPPPLPDKPAEFEEDRLWTQFKEANLEDKQAIFLSALEMEEMDNEYAFEMLSAIRSELDPRDSAAHACYAELVEQLRQQAPDLYKQSIAYYHENLIHDAVADGRWDAIPELLAPCADDSNIDTFFRIVDQLLYHDQIQPLIQVMTPACQQIAESNRLVPWTIDELAGLLMNLNLFDYLARSPAPRANDPALMKAMEVTAPYVEWPEGWLERFVPRLSTPAPSPWQPSDFDEAVDADQWHENLNDLLAEFVSDRHQAGVPYSRGYMAWIQLSKALCQQFSAPAATRGRNKGKKKHTQAPSSPLLPRFQTLNESLGELFPFMGAQPYKAAATVELLPAYVHFLARLTLIHPTEMDTALAELKPLNEHLRALENYGGDPRAVDAIDAAWSEETLSALRDDPALVNARATPPTPPPPQPEKPTASPGAILTYTFKVKYLRGSNIWRTIEIAENQTLDDLHYAILNAVGFDADHLYSFYMSGRAWDDSTEYSSPHANGPNAAKVKIGDLNLRMKQRFLYLFDYGDEHRFEVQLMDVNPDAPKGDYPRVVKRRGKNPSQYDW